MNTKYFVLSLCLLFSTLVFAQYEDLDQLKGYSFKVYYSPGNLERSEDIAMRCESALDYISGLVKFTPEIRLFVLNPEQWQKYTAMEPYGMPHYTDDARLIVASEDNPFWKSFIPPVSELPSELAQKVTNAYSAGGELSMRGFFDLLALHELGHAFHSQKGLLMQRLWMQELFSNIMLHTYIAENEPERLPALVTFPDMVIASGSEEYEYTQLKDFERLYDRMHPKNYGWYQSRLHSAAKDIYNSGGKESFIKLWNGLLEKKEKLSDEELSHFLENNVHIEVAKVQTEW